MKKTFSVLILMATSFQATAEQMNAEQAYQLDQRLPGALTGRPITIDGVTEAPYGPVGGSYLLTLRVSGAPPASGVQASVPADEKPFVSQLQAGSQVRLHCTGGTSGKTGPWLVNCRP